MDAVRKLTPEEYLIWERQASLKSEYRDGELLAMAGASREHNRINTNLVRELSTQLKQSPCDVFSQDMKTRTASTKFAYPDVVIVCGEPEFLDDKEDVVTNPTIIFEILSPNTESYDRGDKFADYQQRASLQEYILVAQDKVSVERYTRQISGLWLYERLARREDTLILSSVDASLLLDEIYYRVTV